MTLLLREPYCWIQQNKWKIDLPDCILTGEDHWSRCLCGSQQFKQNTSTETKLANSLNRLIKVNTYSRLSPCFFLSPQHEQFNKVLMVEWGWLMALRDLSSSLLEAGGYSGGWRRAHPRSFTPLPLRPQRAPPPSSSIEFSISRRPHPMITIPLQLRSALENWNCLPWEMPPGKMVVLTGITDNSHLWMKDK